MSGSPYEMLSSSGNDIHSEISYRNMIYNKKTVLVLMDESKDLVDQGVKAVNEVQPVVQLVETMENPFISIFSNKARAPLQPALEETARLETADFETRKNFL